MLEQGYFVDTSLVEGEQLAMVHVVNPEAYPVTIRAGTQLAQFREGAPYSASVEVRPEDAEKIREEDLVRPQV